MMVLEGKRKNLFSRDYPVIALKGLKISLTL
jgi:hypothetical protein